MPNMNYCRFRNTKSDLEDCLNAIRESEISNSDSEMRAAKRMLKDMCNFLESNGLVVIEEDYDDLIDKLVDNRKNNLSDEE